MQRLLDLLMNGAGSALTLRAECGCDECREARRSGAAAGPCPLQSRRLSAFVSQRLRLESPRGAGVLARLSEDARRYARLMSASQRAGLQPVAGAAAATWERPLTSYPIESES